MKSTYNVEFAGNQIESKEVIARAKKVWVDAGNKNRKVKDLKRLGRGFRNFEHFRNRLLFATRQTPVLNGITDYNPVAYYEEDDF